MDKYELLEQVGKGSFGSVSKIKRKSDGRILVWKEMNYGKMRSKEKQQLVSEVNILREFRHPNIVKYYDRIIDKPSSKIYIVMEYCERGDLGQLIKKHKREGDLIPEDLISRIFTQILLALKACHNRDSGKILHRDIKPGNVLLDSNFNAKLADFGLSRIMGENSVYADTKVGTPYYMSPEQIAELKYNEKSDIWSAGCLLFEMASLSPPFPAKSHVELVSKIKKGEIGKIPEKYSDEWQRIIGWMMNLDYNQRPKVDQILSLPSISLGIREKQIKDETQRLKNWETKIREREEKAKNEKNFLLNKEAEILRKENLAKNNQKLLLTKNKSAEKLFTPKEKTAEKIFTPKDKSAERLLVPKDKSVEKPFMPRYKSVEKFLQAKILDNEYALRVNERRKYSPVIPKRLISPVLRKDIRRYPSLEEKEHTRFLENKENERRKHSPIIGHRIRSPNIEPLKPITNIFVNIANIRKDENRHPFLEEREYWTDLMIIILRFG